MSAKLAGGRLVVSGAPTAKGGAYEAVYQVSQTVGRKTEPGLTIRLSFAVTDVAALDPSAPGANPSVRARRTVPDMMVVDEAGQRLVGILSNLTIQPTGRCTAKYRCSSGTVSLSSRGWAGYDAATGALTARLTVAKKPYALAVTAQPDGTVEAALAEAIGVCPLRRVRRRRGSARIRRRSARPRTAARRWPTARRSSRWS